jgi:hypothetical protein
MSDNAFDTLLDKIVGDMDRIVRGLPVEFKDLRQEVREPVCRAGVHSCVNGPVGVHKPTTFPTLQGTHKIDEWIDGVTNSSWREFCRLIALYIKKTNGELDCNTKRRFGDFWPLYERPSK